MAGDLLILVYWYSDTYQTICGNNAHSCWNQWLSRPFCWHVYHRENTESQAVSQDHRWHRDHPAAVTLSVLWAISTLSRGCLGNAWLIQQFEDQLFHLQSLAVLSLVSARVSLIWLVVSDRHQCPAQHRSWQPLTNTTHNTLDNFISWHCSPRLSQWRILTIVCDVHGKLMVSSLVQLFNRIRTFGTDFWYMSHRFTSKICHQRPLLSAEFKNTQYLSIPTHRYQVIAAWNSHPRHFYSYVCSSKLTA